MILFSTADDLPMPAVWVAKWVDYSQKYGLGYKLSDGTGGVFFNDATKMLLDPSGVKLEYIERIGGSSSTSLSCPAPFLPLCLLDASPPPHPFPPFVF